MKLLKRALSGILAIIVVFCIFLVFADIPVRAETREHNRTQYIYDTPDLPNIHWECGEPGSDPDLSIEGLKSTPEDNRNKSLSSENKTRGKGKNSIIDIHFIITRILKFQLMGFKSF